MPFLKSINRKYLFFVIFALLYGASAYLLSQSKTIPERYTKISNNRSKCTLTYDSTTISESDAKVAYTILENIHYFTPRVPTAQAIFFRDSNNVYTFECFVSRTKFEKTYVDSGFVGGLQELQTNYRNRKYQFHIFTVDSKDSILTRTIKLK
ncbi:MAG: hypothetical protein NTX44_11255 [Ignavibacteriales bacterium]|nr:hypothetical protein [Ignavibacteriales bacterium]